MGGICGESLTIIKRCYALCSVTGNKNVGGIAGFADTLKNCYSMAEIQAENGRAGAIAGQVSGYDIADAGAEDGSGENAAKVVGNYYVGENVHGINNISYVGVAEPIAYEELLAVEQLPAPIMMGYLSGFGGGGVRRKAGSAELSADPGEGGMLWRVA